MVKATMPSTLNTVMNITMRLYGSVEDVVTMCLVYKIRRLLCSYSPPPPPEKKKKKKILDFDSESKFTYQKLKIRFVGLVLLTLFTNDTFQL